MIDIKKNPETLNKLKVGTTAATPVDGEIVAAGVKAETYRSARSDGDVYIQAATASDFVAIGTQDSSTLLKVDGSGHIIMPTAGKTIKTDLSSGGTTRTSVIELYNPSTAALSLKTDNGSTGGIELWTEGQKRLEVQRDGLCTFSNGITVSGGFTTLGSFSEVTIAGGGITVTSSTHRIDTQDDDPSDQLSSISGGTDGSILVLQSVHDDRNVTITHANGTPPQNIHLAGTASFTLDTTNDVLVLIKYGSIWREVSRSDNS